MNKVSPNVSICVKCVEGGKARHFSRYWRPYLDTLFFAFFVEKGDAYSSLMAHPHQSLGLCHGRCNCGCQDNSPQGVGTVVFYLIIFARYVPITLSFLSQFTVH